jgi:hypothetical protein
VREIQLCFVAVVDVRQLFSLGFYSFNRFLSALREDAWQHGYQILFISFLCRRSVALSLPRQGIIRLMQLTLIAIANRSRVTQTHRADDVAVYLGIVSRDAKSLVAFLVADD